VRRRWSILQTIGDGIKDALLMGWQMWGGARARLRLTTTHNRFWCVRAFLSFHSCMTSVAGQTYSLAVVALLNLFT